MKYVQYLKRFLQYLRVHDQYDNLSITNLLVIIMVCKFTFSQTDGADLAALITVVLNYSYKKWLDAP